MTRLQDKPEVRLLVIHIGTNDVGSDLKFPKDHVVRYSTLTQVFLTMRIRSNYNLILLFVFRNIKNLFHKVRETLPSVKMVFSSILPRQKNDFNADVTARIKDINDVIL